jgi:hypothetical protein
MFFPLFHKALPAAHPKYQRSKIGLKSVRWTLFSLDLYLVPELTRVIFFLQAPLPRMVRLVHLSPLHNRADLWSLLPSLWITPMVACAHIRHHLASMQRANWNLLILSVMAGARHCLDSSPALEEEPSNASPLTITIRLIPESLSLVCQLLGPARRRAKVRMRPKVPEEHGYRVSSSSAGGVQM